MSSIYVYANPHPHGIETRDCVVRAIALATGRDYKELRRELNAFKRVLVASKKFSRYTSYKQQPILEEWFKSKNYSTISFGVVRAGEKRKIAKEFAKENPAGTYILSMRRHIVCVKEGKILDTWDSSNKPVYKAWRIK